MCSSAFALAGCALQALAGCEDIDTKSKDNPGRPLLSRSTMRFLDWFCLVSGSDCLEPHRTFVLSPYFHFRCARHTV
ncbi:hypothetical protein F5883DRAFT_547852 [Diaporthe sp. PMI_573]|nr:hypothetical protein F5883DRAFT_547852 [Diaporthaceae sp. PMI_573]